jgi:hypothetical protein
VVDDVEAELDKGGGGGTWKDRSGLTSRCGNVGVLAKAAEDGSWEIISALVRNKAGTRLAGRGVGSPQVDDNSIGFVWIEAPFKSSRGVWSLGKEPLSKLGNKLLVLSRWAGRSGDWEVVSGVEEGAVLVGIFCLWSGSGEWERVEKGEAKKAWVFEPEEGNGEVTEKEEEKETSEKVEEREDEELVSEGIRRRGEPIVPGNSELEAVPLIDGYVDLNSHSSLLITCYLLLSNAYSLFPFLSLPTSPPSHIAENSRNPILVLIAPT